MCDKVRLDVLLKTKFNFSREHSKEIIRKGLVFVDGKIIKRASEKFSSDSNIFVDKKGFLKYVGRGGLKLEKAIEVFDIELSGKVCMDIGASTGGFTDCMLQNGAKAVFAVDVGTHQLAEKLKNDDRVISLENTDVRNIEAENFVNEIEFASVDLSFISVEKVISNIYDILSENGDAVILIKPQFEAGRKNLNKRGIVKNPKIHIKVLEKIYDCCRKSGFNVIDTDFSPIMGTDGNIEYLIFVSKCKQGYNKENFKNSIFDVVKKAHSAFISLK